MMNFIRCISVAGAAMIGLSGCGMFGGKTVKFACPRAGILKEASAVTRFRPGPGRDLTDVVYQARLINLKAACKYGRRGVTVKMTLAMGAERGPAIQGDKANLEYFVAIAGPGGVILAKKEFTTSVAFVNNVTQVKAVDELRQVIPLRRGVSAANHRIIVGFQLQRAELEYNRQLLRR